jgi:hypothetical protein
MFAPEELIVLEMPVEHQPAQHQQENPVEWQKMDLSIEIPAPPASFEDMPLESPVLKHHNADALGDEMLEGEQAHEQAHEQAQQHPFDNLESINIDDDGREFVTIYVYGTHQITIEVTGMTGVEIDAAIEAAYEDAAIDYVLDCPPEYPYA